MDVFWLGLGPAMLMFGGWMVARRDRIPTWQRARGMTRTQPPMLSIVLGGMFLLLWLLSLADGLLSAT